MKTKFNDFTNEKYTGKYQTVGFRYSQPDEQFELKLNIISELNYNDFENKIENKLKNVLDDFNLEIIENSFDNISNIVSENGVKIIIDYVKNNKFNELFLYDIIIDLYTYDEDEIHSLLKEINKDNYLIPNVLLNNKPFDETSKYKHNKLGY